MKMDVKNVNLKEFHWRRFLYVRRFMLLAVTAGVTSLGILFLAILPQIQGLLDTASEVSAEEKVLQSLQQKVEGLEQVNDLSEYQNKDLVDVALPSSKPLLQLLASATANSQLANVRLTEVQTSPGKLLNQASTVASGSATASGSAEALAPVTSTITPIAPLDPDQTRIHGVDILNVTVEVEGSLAQINDFISKMEKSFPVTNVSQIKLSELVLNSQAAAALGPQFSAELRLSSYYFTRLIEVAVDDKLPEIGVTERDFLKELEGYFVPNQTNIDQVQGGGLEDFFHIETQSASDTGATNR